MSKIVGAEGMTDEALLAELQRGGKLVAYQYVISVLVVTFRRQSAVHFIPPGTSAVVRGLPYTLLTLLLGWWGIPWGLIRTPVALYQNLTGGTDLTDRVLTTAAAAAADAAPRP